MGQHGRVTGNSPTFHRSSHAGKGCPYPWCLGSYNYRKIDPRARNIPGGGTPHMKGVGMLMVSLRGVLRTNERLEN